VSKLEQTNLTLDGLLSQLDSPGAQANPSLLYVGIGAWLSAVADEPMQALASKIELLAERAQPKVSSRFRVTAS